MTQEKQPPCCARLAGRLIGEEANLRRLAARAARRAERGQIPEVVVGEIDDAKLAIAGVKEAIANHEAEHAEGGL